MHREVGRPEFQATPAQRRQVEELRSTGESEKAIASVIGCAPHTLTKHFADELVHGGARRRAEVYGVLFKKTRAGNVAAAKYLASLQREAAGDETLRRYERVGKREMERREFEAIADGKGTSWEGLV